MTTVVTVKKEIEKLRVEVAPKPHDVITVRMWRPNGEDAPYDGGRIRVKATNKNETN